MLEKLDSSQRQFCEDKSDYVRLLAPAGCGKTLSLLYRCLYLLKQSKGRPRFLIVTFTVAARQELLSRLNEGPAFSQLRDLTEVTTLNSWGFRRIKNAAFHPKLLTSKADFHFTVLNQLQPVWRNHDAVREAIEANRNQSPGRIMEVINSFKSIGFDHRRHKKLDVFSERMKELRGQGLSPWIDDQLNLLTKSGILKSKVSKRGQETFSTSDKEVYNTFYKFWLDATEHLIASATFTLEDQKYFAYLDERQKVEEGSLLSGAARYSHILVDEFQDINPLDLALISAIVARNKSTLTIVGDDDQAIYEWRGATPEYILNPDLYLEGDFATHTLSTNYRSPKNIVAHSQQLIRHNVRRVDKATVANTNREAEIEIYSSSDLSDAMERVQEEIKEVIGRGHSPSRLAIIGRKRSQLIPYQVYFASRDIPFCAAEDLQVFMSKAFDRVLEIIVLKERSHIRLSSNLVVNDLLLLCGLVKRYPLNKSENDALRKHLQSVRPTTLASSIDALRHFRGSLKGTNTNGNMSAVMADSIECFLGADTVSDTLIELAENFEGLQTDLGKAEDDIFYSDPPFLHLAEFAERYGDDYERFVADIEKAKAQLVMLPPFEDDSPHTPVDLWRRPIHLMTALRAKGKEFESVVLLDVNDGIWPAKQAHTAEQLEAERRVFYVAFTRARSKIIIQISDSFGHRSAVVSPYVRELGLVNS